VTVSFTLGETDWWFQEIRVRERSALFGVFLHVFVAI